MLMFSCIDSAQNHSMLKTFQNREKLGGISGSGSGLLLTIGRNKDDDNEEEDIPSGMQSPSDMQFNNEDFLERNMNIPKKMMISMNSTVN